MGKGYNNFMSKKAFHPGSYANQKRIHEAEAKAEAKRKHDEETLAQYQKEQELFNQKSLVSKLSKEKLSLSFMYETPAGVEKPNDKPLEWRGSSGTGKASTSSGSSSAPLSGGSSGGELSSNICLEWKRDRPVKNSTQHQKQQGQQHQEQNVKQEHVKLEPKVEPLPHKQEKQHQQEQQQQHNDLKWVRKREPSAHPPTHAVKKEEERERKIKVEKEIKPDAKRFKKER